MINPIAFQEEGLTLIDNILSPENFKKLRLMVTNDVYHPVHSDQWHKVWRLWDGNPMRGTTVLYNPRGVFHFHGPVYPTNTSMDLFIEALREAVKMVPEVIGREETNWVGIEISPWIYPPGSALSLHWDARRYTGGFTYFLHAQWGTHWGGELIVESPRVAPDVDAELYIAENGDEDKEDKGIGLAITPKPNRLALIGPDRPHRIARVDANAGSHVRLSIAGFFLPQPSTITPSHNHS